MPQAVLIHLLVALWMYGYLPGELLDIKLITKLGFPMFFKKRLLKPQAITI